MYNYHTGLIFKIDAILLFFILIFTALTIVYAIIKEYNWQRRAGKLLKIKNNIYELVLSGQKLNAGVCLPLASEINLQQFLDASTNRIRDAAFFNETEQKVIKQCFLSGKVTARIENIAKNSWNKWRRTEAILALGYAQAESSTGILKKTINDRDEDIVYFSILALGQIRTVQSSKILLNCLRKNTRYQFKILSVLETFPLEIAENIASFLDDKNPQIRIFALRLISKLKPAGYLKRIEELTEDDSEEVCAAACNCLGELGAKEAKDVLAKCLKHNFWLVRAEAVMALSKISGKDCLSQIIERIHDPSLSVIESVESVLAGHIEPAMPYIEKFLYGDDVIAKRTCVKALEISGYLLKLLNDILSENDKGRNHSLKVLEGMILSRAHFGLETALLNFTVENRAKILDAIRKIDKAMATHIEQSMAGRAD
ncbi:MAG: HEAT repeat domain-containing protein [Candidatus Omnitrophica bacterium]|nr:HEAT repeat domain-containing protein [Candidatus Omnitrophota bacterium]